MSACKIWIAIQHAMLAAIFSQLYRKTEKYFIWGKSAIFFYFEVGVVSVGNLRDICDLYLYEWLYVF